MTSTCESYQKLVCHTKLTVGRNRDRRKIRRYKLKNRMWHPNFFKFYTILMTCHWILFCRWEFLGKTLRWRFLYSEILHKTKNGGHPPCNLIKLDAIKKIKINMFTWGLLIIWFHPPQYHDKKRHGQYAFRCCVLSTGQIATPAKRLVFARHTAHPNQPTNPLIRLHEPLCGNPRRLYDAVRPLRLGLSSQGLEKKVKIKIMPQEEWKNAEHLWFMTGQWEA